MSPRTYPVPKRAFVEASSSLSALIASGSVDSSVLERISRTYPMTAAGEWATKTLRREVGVVLDAAFGDAEDLPLALMSSTSPDVVIGLVKGDSWLGPGGWEGTHPRGELIDIDEETVAFVAAAFTDGMDGVLLRAAVPLAVITAASDDEDLPVVPPSIPELPEGTIHIAVVDELDKDAVLDLVAIAPGPVVYRRNDGVWYEDPGWLTALRSATPPPVVKLDDSVFANVLEQVDAATAGLPWENTAPIGMKASASEWLMDYQREEDEAMARYVIVAASKAAASIKGHAVGAEKLRRYWSTGEGALKIRWGTPGSWTRCHRHLSKYLGPRAAGYCTNLCQRLGGYGVACHVGDKAKSLLKSAARKVAT